MLHGVFDQSIFKWKERGSGGQKCYPTKSHGNTKFGIRVVVPRNYLEQLLLS